MDLALGAKQTFVMMNLLARDGTPKLVTRCSFPLTGVQCVRRIYTDLATFEITDEGVLVREVFGVTFAELTELLEVPIMPAASWGSDHLDH